MPRLLPAALAVLTTACAARAPVADEARPLEDYLAERTAARVLPYPLDLPPEFQAAVAASTRTLSGAPGAAYWVNRASYAIDARVLPETPRVEGGVRIAYTNHSPDALAELHVDLTQNFHAPGVVRHEPAEVTGGVALSNVALGGRQISAGVGPGTYVVNGTRMVLTPAAPVAPGATVELAMDFAYDVPQAGAGARMGYDKDDLIFLAYWYPQMAVYDDVVGWHTDPFTGTTEFYADHGRYDVTIEAPAPWVVNGTGSLENAADVLSPTVHERLVQAHGSDTTLAVYRPGSGVQPTGADPGSPVLWRFTAEDVRDVAYSLSLEPNWDARRTSVGGGEYTLIQALWRDSAPLWSQVARYAAHAIRFFSEYLGLSYPWPHMTAVEGGSLMGGGMEYPMMTLMGDYNARGDSALYWVTAHELAHMWIPMIVSTDERRFSWFDEGTTTFNENQARKDFYPGIDHDLPDQDAYLAVARAGLEGPIMRRSAYHVPGPAYGTASYAKPGTVLAALSAVLGEETFERALRAFVDRWAWKHPYPWDFWHTFEDVSGRELDWFWRSWYHETWVLDQAVRSVTVADGQTHIEVEDLGRVPMPVHLVVTLADGRTVRREIPVDVWLAGAVRASITVPGTATRVEIDPERDLPDADRTNNVWRR